MPAPAKNLIHPPADAKDAGAEVLLWFSGAKQHSYQAVHDVHILWALMERLHSV